MIAKILLIEDETDVMLSNQEFLEQKGFDILCADTLQDAKFLLQKTPVDLILLDINLPDGSGLEFVKTTRKNSSIPVIFLTCRTDKDDIVEGLLNGGNDYLTKPYDLEILHAHIMANLQKRNELNSRYVTVENIEIDIVSQKVYLDKKDAFLKPKEFSLFLYLVQYKNTILSASHLYQTIWNVPANGDTRTIRVHISSLRKKLNLKEENNNIYIETLPSEGYCLRIN